MNRLTCPRHIESCMSTSGELACTRGSGLARLKWQCTRSRMHSHDALAALGSPHLRVSHHTLNVQSPLPIERGAAGDRGARVLAAVASGGAAVSHGRERASAYRPPHRRTYCACGVADYVARDDASSRISSKREREPDRPEVQFPVSSLRRRAALPPPVNVILLLYSDLFSHHSNHPAASPAHL